MGKAKSSYRRELDDLTERLVHLHRALYAERRQGLLVVLQGRDAAGKSGVIRKVFGRLDQQEFRVIPFRRPTSLELRHDYLWRVHAAAPPRGAIHVFDRSHYEDVLAVRVHGLVPEAEWRRRYNQINAFEQYLTENGIRVLKFFLDISWGEQLVQLRERLEDPEKNWKFDKGDLAERERWDEYTHAYEDVLARCSTEWAPWHVVPSDDRRERNLQVARTVVATREEMAPRFPAAHPELLALLDTIG